MLFFSCLGKQDNAGGTDGKNPDKIPEWNKNRTLRFSVASSLTDSPMQEACIPEIGKFLEAAGPEILLLERTDVDCGKSRSKPYVPNVLSENSLYFYAYGVNKYRGEMLEGNSILLKHKINGERSHSVTGGTYLKIVDAHLKTITEKGLFYDVKAGIIRIEDRNGVKSLADILNTHYSKDEIIIFASVKADYADEPAKVFSSFKKYKVTPVGEEVSSPYKLYVIAGRSWLKRNVEIKKLSNGVNIYDVYVESGVDL